LFANKLPSLVTRVNNIAEEILIESNSNNNFLLHRVNVTPEWTKMSEFFIDSVV
jgi:hypothetical protein